MARLGINTGTAPNDGTGDTLFLAGDKTNKNFSELYTVLGDGTNLNTGFVTSINAGDNISISGSTDVTITGIAVTSDINADRLVVAGVSTLTNQVKIVSDDSSPGRIDYYCETNNAHYTRVQAAPHAEYTGNATVTLPTSDGTILLTDGDGSALTGIVTGIVAGSNVTVSNTDGTYTINSSGGGGGGSGVSIGYASTEGDTPRIVGTSVTQINLVGTGYTVVVSNNIATVRNLGMGMTTLSITSPGYATTTFAGSQVSYTAVASDANAKFHIEDRDGLQIGINYDSGVVGGGQNAAAGTYDVRIRAATFFGMSEPKDVRFVIAPFTLSMNTMFGDTESFVAMTDANDDAVYVSLSSYGVVAYDGANYVIDRTGDVFADYQKYGIYYDNTNNELYGYRVDSGGSIDSVRRWTSVTNATDGTDVGSGTALNNSSIVTASLKETSSLTNGKDYTTLTLDAGIGDFDGVYNRQSFKANLDTGTASSGNALFNADDGYWWFLKNGDNTRIIIYDTVGSTWAYVYVSGADFSSAADGTALGSPNATETQSINSSVYGGGAVQPESEYSEISYGAGTGIGAGAFQPFGNYTHFMGGSFAMKITTSGGLLNNFGTKASPDAGWSYGFTLEDPWLVTSSGQQMLTPESASDGWHIFGVSIFDIGATAYDYLTYGYSTGGPYTTSSGVNLTRQANSNNIANAGDTIQVRWDGNNYKLYINGVQKVSNTSPGSYLTTSTTTNPTIVFGDTSLVNGGNIINGYGQPMPWQFRIRDLWIANNGNISAADVVGVSTFRDRNIASWSEYSDVDVYITLDENGVTAVKGSPTVERKSITFS